MVLKITMSEHKGQSHGQYGYSIRTLAGFAYS